MLTIQLTIVDPNSVDEDELRSYSNVIINKLISKRFLAARCERFSVQYNKDGVITIQFQGVISDEGSGHYISRSLMYMLSKMGLEKIMYLSGMQSTIEHGDRVLDESTFKPGPTSNSVILGPLLDDSETIPLKYICSMTHQIMDDPVYLSSTPEIKYNKADLKFWLYSHPQSLDPFTQLHVNVCTDIKNDSSLKEEIRNHVQRLLIEGREKSVKRFQEVIKKYIGDDVSVAGFDKAFRNAAARNNVEDMRILEKRISSVNAQDTNELKKYTALHWAVEKNCPEALKFLLEMAARRDIKNAQGKTALDIAREQGSDEINVELGVNNDQGLNSQTYYRF